MSRSTTRASSLAFPLVDEMLLGIRDEDRPVLAATQFRLEGILSQVRELSGIVDREIDIGVPDDGNGSTVVQNIRGAWAIATLTNSNELGSGAGSPVTFTHNLDLLVETVTGPPATTLPNVRPLAWMFTHGSKSAPSNPTAAANQAHSSFYFRLGDTVAADSIEMRVHSGLTINATDPLLVEIFFTPALR